ncbi:MAG: hypothetical protein ACN6OJ_14010 [Chryseobacterium sp.]|jgi:hypothetical protein|uniref:hypothetical protein n=1 Tax=Chryseobacterium sp. TaxID=1871047 RepID=UPI003D0A83CE
MKTFLFILKILRWILGVFCLLISLGLFIEQSFAASVVMLVFSIFLVPLTGDFISSKVMKINPDGTYAIVKAINYSHLHTILPTYEQNVFNRQKPLSDKQKIRLGRKIYYHTLCAAISDFNLTQNETHTLNEIKVYFNLSEQQMLLEKKRISEKTVKNLIQNCYADHVLTDSENQQITNIATFLQFPLDKTEAIKNKIAFSLFNRLLEEKISDKRLSPMEETELKQATRNLKIDHQSIKTFISERKIKSLHRESYCGVLIMVFSRLFTTLL